MSTDTMLLMVFALGLAVGASHGWYWCAFLAERHGPGPNTATVTLTITLGDDMTHEDVFAVVDREFAAEFAARVLQMRDARRIIQAAHAKHSEAA